jgi:hypothetical protein
MVSHRCKLAVRSALEMLGLQYKYVDLGEIDLFEDSITEENREKLSSLLLKSGLELMDNKKSILVERIKNTLIELIHYSEELPRNNISEFVSEKLDHDYTYLSNLFKEVTGTTIQHYILLHKIHFGSLQKLKR